MAELPLQKDKPAVHITAGLLNVAAALRNQAWEGGTARRLTPTQGRVLTVLAERQGLPISLGELAGVLAVTPATASDAVGVLERKGLVRKGRSAADGRSLRMTLTAQGLREAGRVAGWTDGVRAAVETLSSEEQAVFLRGLTKVIRSLQEQGVISTTRMCAGCDYFRPHAHADAVKPHHCAFVDKSIGDRQLRLDCPDFVPVSEVHSARRWQGFLRGGQDH